MVEINNQSKEITIGGVFFSYNTGLNSNGCSMKIVGKALKKMDILSILKDLDLKVYGKILEYYDSSILPLHLAENYIEKVNVFEKDGLDEFEINFYFGTDNHQMKIAHSQIEKELKKLYSNGDMPIEFEFLHHLKKIFSFYSRPSMIHKSFDSIEIIGKTSAMLLGFVPNEFQLRKKTWKHFIWLILSFVFINLLWAAAASSFLWFILPALFSISIWVSYYNSNFFKANFPGFLYQALDKFSFKKNKNIPLTPCTLSQSWNVSRLEYEYRVLETNANQDKSQMDEILKKIGQCFRTNREMKVEEIENMYKRIQEFENEESVSQKVFGFFKFVNLLWLLSIIGISVSIGPSIWVITEPIRGSLHLVLIWFWNHVIIPCHNHSILEMFFYFICSAFIFESYKFNKESGFYVAFTGVALAIPTYCYTISLHSPFREAIFSLRNSEYVLNRFWVCSFLLPVALHYKSSLLAWIITVLFYHFMGFTFVCRGLCYIIGFESHDELERTIVSSLILIIIFVTLKITKISNLFIQIFQKPMITFGSIMLFFSLLIFSSKFNTFHYVRFESDLSYFMHAFIMRQIIFIVAMTAGLVIGNIWNVKGLKNTAIVFLVLFLMEKYNEAHILDFSGNLWILLLINSVFLYRSALFLHRNSDFVVAMFSY